MEPQGTASIWDCWPDTGSPETDTSEVASRKRILVVDEDHDMVKALELFLCLEGFEVMTAYNGMSALQEIEMSAPDAVILDIKLPIIDGLMVLRHLRNGMGRARTPVIVLTGLAEPKWRDDMLDAGADEFIVKPCNPGALLSSIRRQLRRTATATYEK